MVTLENARKYYNFTYTGEIITLTGNCTFEEDPSTGLDTVTEMAGSVRTLMEVPASENPEEPSPEPTFELRNIGSFSRNLFFDGSSSFSYLVPNNFVVATIEAIIAATDELIEEHNNSANIVI